LTEPYTSRSNILVQLTSRWHYTCSNF